MGLKLGEVIETNTREFVAHCYELKSPPQFGSMVKVNSPPHQIYGFVVFISVTSIEPGRRPVAIGRDVETVEEIYQMHPQLSRLLAAEFTVITAGFSDGSRIHQYTPPCPPPLHSFVESCTPEEIVLFSSSLDFLNILIQIPLQVPREEVIPAVIRNLASFQKDRFEFLVRAGRELVRLLINDSKQLGAILRRVE